MNSLEAWEKAQDAIKTKIGATTYETWFSSLGTKEKGASHLIIEAPDEFFKNWIIEHYLGLIQES